MKLLRQKRIWIPVLVLVMALLLWLLLPVGRGVLLRSTGGEVQVILGRTDGVQAAARQRALDQLAEEQPQTQLLAVAPLDGYYTVEETEDMIAAHGLDVVRAFLWTPRETGKLVLNVEDNDLSGELAGFASAQAGRRNDAMAADLQQLLDGGEHVYALVLRGGAAELAGLAAAEPRFVSVDPRWAPGQEAFAQRWEVPFSYVELPDKPDGAL